MRLGGGLIFGESTAGQRTHFALREINGSSASISPPSAVNSASMHRRLTSILLMLCMCWQSLAYAGADLLVAEGQELVHAMLHFEGTAHHHDGHDGEFHLDESLDSTQHAMTDACVFPPALLIDLQLPLLSARPAAPPSRRSPS